MNLAGSQADISEDVRKRLEEKFTDMMSALYEQKGASLRIEILGDPKVTDFIDAHAGILDSSFERTEMSDLMRERLQQSDWMFSGMKTFHELNEAFPSLLDEDGGRKPFERFLNDVQSIDRMYNRNYLNAEYNFAQASAGMAAKWERYADDGDDYYLQYRTAGDNKVRPEHAELNGVTLPRSDSFWDVYFPPNGWNCRCTVVQVLKDRYKPTSHDEAMRRGANVMGDGKTAKMFAFNPGKQQKVFPDYNPYTISKCSSCPKADLKLAAGIADNELCEACLLLKVCSANAHETVEMGKGRILINNAVSREDSDYSKLYQIAEHFAKEGSEVVLTPKMTRPSKFKYDCIYSSLRGTKYEGKCPDLCIDGVWYEHEGFITDNAKHAFRNMMRDGLKQSSRLIIDKPNLTNRYMVNVILGRINRGELIDEVWLRNVEGNLSLLYKKTDS